MQNEWKTNENKDMVIQRIQTLYLLIATVLMGIFAFMPALEVSADSVVNAISAITPDYTMLTLVCLNIVVMIITIFKFKDLKAQMRLCKVCMLLTVTLIAVVCALWVLNTGDDTVKCVATYWNLLLPAALVLEILAHKGMSHDRKLLSDSRRIR